MKPTARVSQQTLDQIRGYIDQKLKAAIPAVNAENQDMQFYEVVPIASVVASIMAACGHRNQNSVQFLEMQLVGSPIGKPVM